MKKVMLMLSLFSMVSVSILIATKTFTQPMKQLVSANSCNQNIKEYAQKLAAEINSIDNEIRTIGTQQRRRLRIK